MDDKKRTLLIGLGGTFWLLAVMLAYASTHKPFSPAQLTVLLKVFWQVSVAGLIVSFGGGIGVKLFPRRDNVSPLAALAVQAALGLGSLGLLILLLGYTLGFSSTIFALLLLFGLVLFRNEILLWWREWRVLSVILSKSQRLDKILAMGVGLILAMTLATALSPPLKFDALVYHLTLPKLYLLNGGVKYLPELVFWGMPQEAEMLYTFAMALAGAEAAAVVGWTFGVLTLVALLGYLSERFSVRAAWVALASLLAGGSLTTSLAWAYVGWATMLYGIALFILLDLWIAEQKQSLLSLAALLAGFALGTKYTAGILLAAAVPVIFLAKYKCGFKETIKALLSFGGIAFLVFSPWLIKNFVAVGNPVYPLLFPAGAMDEYRLFLYQGDVAWGNWQDLFLLPWRATVFGGEGKVGYSADIGSLLLGLSAFAWLGWREREAKQKEALRMAFLMLSVGVFIWAIAGRTSRLLIQTRLYLSVFPLWAILAGIGFENLARIRTNGVRFGRIAATLVLLAFGFNLYAHGTQFAAWRVAANFFGAQTPASYRERALGAYATVTESLAKLPAEARILMLWETRGLDCVPQCEADETIDRWYADLRTYGSSAAVLSAWQRAGYSHLLFYRKGAEFIRENDVAYREEDWVALRELLDGLILVEEFGGEYQLYRLR
jgi:hypothetical protein